MAIVTADPIADHPDVPAFTEWSIKVDNPNTDLVQICRCEFGSF